LHDSFRIMEKAAITFHSRRFLTDWASVADTINMLDIIGAENEQALVACEPEFSLIPAEASSL